jgi:cytochrome o ubiquinol oxidase subunit 1
MTLEYHDIHLPKNTPVGFVAAIFAGIFGFAMIWHMVIPAIVGFAGAILSVITKTFFDETEYVLPASVVKATELTHWKEHLNG